MKKGLLFIGLMLIAASIFSQGKEGVIKVRKKISSTPTISGLAGGEIEASLLCSGEGIIINKNIKVISFVFYADYGSKEISIKHNGNSFNKDACELIAVLKSGAEVYINEISVIDNNGRESITTPMRFTIK
jgi:hypothetical protein